MESIILAGNLIPNEVIEEAAEFGAAISKWMRHPWTGEQIAVTVRFDSFGFRNARRNACLLEQFALLAVEDVADLRQYRIVKSGQHAWSKADWLRAIRAFKGR